MPVSRSSTSRTPSGGFSSNPFTSLATLARVRGGKFSLEELDEDFDRARDDLIRLLLLLPPPLLADADARADDDDDEEDDMMLYSMMGDG